MKKLTFIVIGLLVIGLTVQVGLSQEDEFGGGTIHFEKPAPGVVFSHPTHVGDYGFDCDTCHDGLFEYQAGAAAAAGDFTMDSMEEGNYCGACHDGSTAFSVTENCATCHEDGGDIIYTEPVVGVLFSHKTHGDEMGFGCESCHEGMFKMEALAAQQNDDFTMESLYQGKYCGACHDGSTAFASDTQCATCHIGVKGYLKATGQDSDPGEKGH